MLSVLISYWASDELASSQINDCSSDGCETFEVQVAWSCPSRMSPVGPATAYDGIQAGMFHGNQQPGPARLSAEREVLELVLSIYTGMSSLGRPRSHDYRWFPAYENMRNDRSSGHMMTAQPYLTAF